MLATPFIAQTGAALAAAKFVGVKMSADVIPIWKNKLDALSTAIKVLSKQTWGDKETRTALLIQRDGFSKQIQVPNPPPERWMVAKIPRIEFSREDIPPSSEKPVYDRVEFVFDELRDELAIYMEL